MRAVSPMQDGEGDWCSKDLAQKMTYTPSMGMYFSETRMLQCNYRHYVYFIAHRGLNRMVMEFPVLRKTNALKMASNAVLNLIPIFRNFLLRKL